MIQASRMGWPLQVFAPGSPAFHAHAERMAKSMVDSAARRARAIHAQKEKRNV